jgi:hypothetical protein
VVEIWTEREDGIWIYVEQAASSSLDKPYRQRIYSLTAKENETLESAVYTFDKPEKFIGSWKNKEKLSAISPDSINLKEGCSIVIKKVSDKFVGSTHGKNCPSNLRGASFATSEVVIDKYSMTSWDRGYNDKDEQVWGAEIGPYIFKKIK